uniref:Calcineurin-binding protein cabin-1 MEF2-binding domain-containing protein n=1 Tax=Neolamprologus brichardi TaxID=32507 RepID=A0A3Q4GUP0_NEOBR
MTTTDTSNKPSSDDSKHAVPKKPGLTEGACATDPGPREASQAQLTPAPLPSIDKGSKVQEGYPGKAETPGNEGHKAGPAEPMDLDICHWRKPSNATDSQGTQTQAETSVSGTEPQQKVTDISRTPELSLEELSISSRQQQLQASAPKITVAASGTDQGLLRKPNRKRKLLEDVESGKTLLLDAYRVWQQGQKVMTYDLGRIEKIMSETYMLIKQVDEDVALDQAVKFCQIQLATSAQRQVNLCNSACSSATFLLHPHLHIFPHPCATRPLLPRLPTDARPGQPLHLPPAVHPGQPSQGGVRAPEQAAQTSDLRLPRSATAQERSQPLCCSHGLPATDRYSISYKNMRRLDSTDNAHNSTVSDCARLLSFSSTLFLSDQQQYASNDQSKLPDPSRIRSRVPPNMPKLFIPSTVTKFPPEITVTPPTPTLLSPKGSISEETKQRLKGWIWSAAIGCGVSAACQLVLRAQNCANKISSTSSRHQQQPDSLTQGRMDPCFHVAYTTF